MSKSSGKNGVYRKFLGRIPVQSRGPYQPIRPHTAKESEKDNILGDSFCNLDGLDDLEKRAEEEDKNTKKEKRKNGRSVKLEEKKHAPHRDRRGSKERHKTRQKQQEENTRSTSIGASTLDALNYVDLCDSLSPTTTTKQHHASPEVQGVLSVTRFQHTSEELNPGAEHIQQREESSGGREVRRSKRLIHKAKDIEACSNNASYFDGGKNIPVVKIDCEKVMNSTTKKNINKPNADSEPVSDEVKAKISDSLRLHPTTSSVTTSDSVCDTESPCNILRSSHTTTKSPQTTTGSMHYASKSPLINNNSSRTSATTKSPHTITHDSSSFLSTQEKMEISSWGLPDAVLERYHESGIHTMFPWQVECLSQPGVVEGKNLVYSAPTSAGKTLVAEMLLLKRVVEEGKKGLFILPFVSVAREKMYYLQKMFGSVGVRVDGFMGSQSPPGGLKNTDIAVCTIEKANNLINRLLEETTSNNNSSSSSSKKKGGGGKGLMGGVGVVVVDELHLVGDQHRGYLLELLLTKLTFLTRSSHLALDKHDGVQIIGMSATLPNLPVLASWLGDAALYTTTHRPVPLQECCKLGTSIYDSRGSCIRQLSPVLTVEGDSEHVTQLCLETILEGYSVLIFCPTKSWCESLSATIAKHFFNIGRTDSKYPDEVGERLRGTLDREGISRVLDALRRCPVGLDSTLARTVAFGAAYHHAGLTLDERDIIEGGFRAGSVRVLVATSTLCSGVNLPARRVIIRSLSAGGGGQLDPMTYKQMVGRAGRKGVDTEGESIIVCSSESEAKRARSLLTSHTLPPITSCLHTHNSLSASMKRAILEVIVSGLTASPEEVNHYCNCTLLAATLRDQDTEINKDENADSENKMGDSENNDCSTQQPSTLDSVTACLTFLMENEFIRKQEVSSGGTKYIGTQLGLAVVGSGLSPDEGLRVFSELHRARQCFVLENELHILYQVTPTYICSGWAKLDWAGFLESWEMLGEGGRRVGQLVGVDESFIVRAMKGAVNIKARKQAEQLAVHQRFYTALALQELVQEVSVGEVAARFGAARGALQALQQAAATFAGMVTVLCSRLGWDNLALLLGQFLPRLHHGARSDLCDLLRLPPPVDASTARHFHSAGLTTVAAVARSGANVVEDVLHAATPFHSTKMESNERTRRQGGRLVLLVSGRSLTEAQAARLIVAEARQLVQKDLGISNIAWSSNPSENLCAAATPLDSFTHGLSLPATTGSPLDTVKPSDAHSKLTLAAGRGIKRLSPLAAAILRKKSKSPRYSLVPKEKGQGGDLENIVSRPIDSTEEIQNDNHKAGNIEEKSGKENVHEVNTEEQNTEHERKPIERKPRNQENQGNESNNSQHLQTKGPVKTDNVKISDQSTITNNEQSLKTCTPTKEKVGLAAGMLFRRSKIKKTQEVTVNKKEEGLVFIPESQENKSDNVFSPKGRKERIRKRQSGKEAERSKKDTEEPNILSVDRPGILTNKKRSNKALFKLASNIQSENAVHRTLKADDNNKAKVNKESPMKVPSVSDEQIRLPKIIVEQVDETRKMKRNHINEENLDGTKRQTLNSSDIIIGQVTFTSSTPIIDTRIKAITTTSTTPHQLSNVPNSGQAFKDVTPWITDNNSKLETQLRDTEDNSDLFNESCDDQINSHFIRSHQNVSTASHDTVDGRGAVHTKKAVGVEDSQNKTGVQHRKSRCSSEFLTDSQKENFLITMDLEDFHLMEDSVGETVSHQQCVLSTSLDHCVINDLSNEDQACKLSGISTRTAEKTNLSPDRSKTSILSCSSDNHQQKTRSKRILSDENELFHQNKRPAHELSPSLEDSAEPYPDDVYEILTQNEQQAELQNKFPAECMVPANQKIPTPIKNEVSCGKNGHNEHKPQQCPEYINNKHNNDADDDEPLYPACIEYFDFGSDFSNCDADSPTDGNSRRFVSTNGRSTGNLDGSYLDTVPQVLPGVSVESVSIVSFGSEGLNDNVCEWEEDKEQNEQRVPVLKEEEKGESQKQRKNKDKNCVRQKNEIEKDHTLSDSFLEHAFDSYLQLSACETTSENLSKSNPIDKKQGITSSAEKYVEKTSCQENYRKSPENIKWNVAKKDTGIKSKPSDRDQETHMVGYMSSEAVQTHCDVIEDQTVLDGRLKHQRHRSTVPVPLSSRESIPQSKNYMALQENTARNVEPSHKSHDIHTVSRVNTLRLKERSVGNMEPSFKSPDNSTEVSSASVNHQLPTFSQLDITPRTEALLEGRLDSACNSHSTERKHVDVYNEVSEHKLQNTGQQYDTMGNISPFLQEDNQSVNPLERGRLSDDLFLSPMSSRLSWPEDINEGRGKQGDEAATRSKAEDSRSEAGRKNKTEKYEIGRKNKTEKYETGKKIENDEVSRVVGVRPKKEKHTQQAKYSPEISNPVEAGRKMNKTRKNKEKTQNSRAGTSEDEKVTTPLVGKKITKGASEASPRFLELLTPATREYLVQDFHQPHEEAKKPCASSSLAPASKQCGFSEILTPNTRKFLAQDFHQPQEEVEKKNISAMINSVALDNKQSTSNMVQELEKVSERCNSAGDMTNFSHRDLENSSEVSNSTRTSLQNSSSLCIIDVAGDVEVFMSFLREVKQQPMFALSLACQKITVNNGKKNGIGWRISHHGRPSRRSHVGGGGDVAGVVVEGSEMLVVGLAVCWGHRDAYYLNLRTVQEEAMSVTMPTPPLAAGVSFKDRVEAVKRLVEDDRGEGVVMRLWDAKAAVHILAKAGLGCVSGRVQDPHVAAWLLDPNAKQSNLHNMVVNYDLGNLDLLAGVGGGQGTAGLGQDTGSSESPRVRAATECVAVFHLVEALRTTLTHHGLLKPYVEVEMPCVVSMAYMELSGMGFSSKECQAQKTLLQKRLAALESEAFRLAGHPFHLSSPAQVSQVLYRHLHLPLPGPAHTMPTPARGGRGSGSCVCGPTSKEALEHLSPHHPLPAVILEWRKITASLTKVVCPIQQARVHSRSLAMERIHSTAHTFTATGRITLHSPCLQSVLRDFTIQVTSGDSEEKAKGHQRHFANTAILDQLAPTLGSGESVAKTVSVRRSLIAGRGRVLLAADYCQVELRLLAHFSADPQLLHILGEGGNKEEGEQDRPDVFTAIAAQLHHTHHTQVTPDERQKAKQICYGILYGMGTRALGEELGVGEEDAEAFMKGFHALYPVTHTYLQEAVEACRAASGLVETLLGRHRHLPNIDSQDTYLRSQSERQAVNTKIQGSAADLVKLAGIRIEEELREAFPSAPRYITHPRSTNKGQPLRGAFLVLHLHDELIFEVCNEDVVQVSQVVRQNMEKVWPLRVPLPVKIQVGPSWGSLQPFIL
ncbi:hypothetical protein Pcinc_004462 [Petrolisthes cinctipes]|uniref:DNA-directed DNA polymerase n=1 Tax=Petrolisthes cinctipes TaxID=88211 RepID=A0AAE1L036_PETCI|nr:hypothetical protein Pcinc_004462 [Petrolisthes cinctipes]